MTVPHCASPGVRELAGKVALVTGAARNIGRAIAIELAEAGAAVLVAARTSRQDAEQTCGLIRANGGRAELALADLGEPGGAARVVDACVGAFGQLDMVVTNAALRSDGPIETIDAKEWQRVVSSILDATFFCAQAAGPHLRRSGGGTFITLGGVAAHTGIAGRTHVSAAKAGVVGLTRALATEWAPDGITVNCVSPGYIGTERHDAVPRHFRDRPVPLGRPGTPQEVAGAVRYLVGPSGRFITGQVLHLNGGWHMGG
ncbi:MAG: 3-oxoacyl-[acyl-carrier protein] reductase [Rhodospirillaceae bacterium]|nr:3-oxoacyl-[acyl-carrier protein] reductase [Rhodospirillaceae bacterium]